MTLTGDSTLIDSGFHHPPNNPMILFQQWLKKAEEIGVCEPRSMTLATVDEQHRPACRILLLKECDEEGIIFSTSEESAKGNDLSINPWAAGNLWWRETLQQVNFRGKVSPLSSECSDTIFAARPREAQAVSALSKQSAPLKKESDLQNQIRELIDSGKKIDRPSKWHAYYLAVTSIEFWVGSRDRFHQRLRYDLIDHVWKQERLQP